MTTRIILLPGMTPNDMIFDRLRPLLSEAHIVSWIPPNSRESLQSYAIRLAGSLPQHDPCIVCGVSFGGIVAQEVAHHLPARACVLISSIRHPRELPPWFRLLQGIPRSAAELSLAGAGRFADLVPGKTRTASTTRLRKLCGASGAWYRWATSAVLGWHPTAHEESIPILQIHGDRDETFPLRFLRPDRVVRGGGHVLPLSHPGEVADFIVEVCKTYSIQS